MIRDDKGDAQLSTCFNDIIQSDLQHFLDRTFKTLKINDEKKQYQVAIYVYNLLLFFYLFLKTETT